MQISDEATEKGEKMTNELIAEKVMGWNRVDDRPRRPLGWEIGKVQINYRDTPDFLADMNAAMMVIDYMKDRGYKIKMWAERGFWWCKYDRVAFNCDVTIQSKSLPYAICEAALKAMETVK